MPGLDSPTPVAEKRDFKVERYNARLGLVLFFMYLAAYTAYVLVSAFSPSVMDVVSFAGLNYAVTSGMVLILGAMGLAALYANLCRKPWEDRA